MYTPAEAVEMSTEEATETSGLPSESLLHLMFPREDITSWIERNSITEGSIRVSSILIIVKVVLNLFYVCP